MSSAQGEDTVLYVHDENCCDDMMPEYEGSESNTRRREQTEAYKKHLRDKYCMDDPPSFEAVGTIDPGTPIKFNFKDG